MRNDKKEAARILRIGAIGGSFGNGITLHDENSNTDSNR